MIECVICLRPAPTTAVAMCGNCIRAFRNTDGLDMIGVVEWVAKRTRYFERRRK